MDKIYAGVIGLGIIADCGRDVSAATNAKIIALRPDGVEVEWDAQVHTVGGAANYLRYVSQDGDLDMPGRYQVQASLTLGDWTGRGKTDDFIVYKHFE